MGTALTSCVTPEKGEPTFDLVDDEIRLGVDIHGEPGTERTGTTSADEVAEELAESVLDDLDPDSGQVVVSITNGMGATPQIELFVVKRRLQSLLSEHGLETWNAWVGDYINDWHRDSDYRSYVLRCNGVELSSTAAVAERS